MKMFASNLLLMLSLSRAPIMLSLSRVPTFYFPNQLAGSKTILLVSVGDCNLVKVLPIAGAAAVVAYLVYRKVCKGGCCGGKDAGASCGRINTKIDLDKEKVSTMVDSGEIGEKAAFCRCWKSDKVRTKNNQSSK